jgi:hypothetical protein
MPPRHHNVQLPNNDNRIVIVFTSELVLLNYAALHLCQIVNMGKGKGKVIPVQAVEALRVARG